jgi:hypothetical protein
LKKARSRLYHGRQFASHDWWAESHGNICDFKRWEQYESQHLEFMGHRVTPSDTRCDTDCDTENEVGVTAGVTPSGDISERNELAREELQPAVAG